MEEVKELLNIFRKKNIQKLTFNFDCGNDEFGSLEFESAVSSGKVSSNNPLTKKEYETIREFILSTVEFYEISGDSYIGEQGTVTLEIEKNTFRVIKESDNMMTEVKEVEKTIDDLTTKEKLFLSKVAGINLNLYSRNYDILYKEGFCKPSKEIEESICAKIESNFNKICSDIPEGPESIYNCNIEIYEDKIIMYIRYSYEFTTSGDYREYIFEEKEEAQQ